DAARIDGAGWWGQLRHVTLPMMSPVIFYTLVLGVVEVLQYFLVPLVLNQGTGEPGGATRFYNLYLYKTFFAFQEMSYGATLAWLLFLITLAFTGILFWSARYWVYYAVESSSSGPARDRNRSTPHSGGPAAGHPLDSSSFAARDPNLVPRHVLCGGAHRGLPFAPAPLLRALVPDTRAGLAGRRSALARESSDLHLQWTRLSG